MDYIVKFTGSEYFEEEGFITLLKLLNHLQNLNLPYDHYRKLLKVFLNSYNFKDPRPEPSIIEEMSITLAAQIFQQKIADAN